MASNVWLRARRVQFDKGGQITSPVDGSCLALADGDTSGGGAFAMEACSASAESGDGRTVFSLTPGGQLKMPRLGNYCVTMAGESAASSDIAQGADLTATSSNGQ